jgi:hypothetical protein
MIPLQFDRLNPTEFEEFCFALLEKLHFQDIDWRKGTPKAASPSDSGRDIEATSQATDPGGARYRQKWFIECKHYAKGVPAEALHNALSWATSERPDVLLFIVSGYLSNAAKGYLETYQQNNRPMFRITVWERPRLQTLAAEHLQILLRIRLLDRPAHVELAHPLHLQLLAESGRNSLDQFFAVLEKLEPSFRDNILMDVMLKVIHLPDLKSVDPNKPMGETIKPHLTYTKFKNACENLRQLLPESCIADFMVTSILRFWLTMGDSTRLGSVRENRNVMREVLEGHAAKAGDSGAINRRLIEMLQDDKDILEQRAREDYEIYVRICDELVRPLLLQANH